MKAVLCALGALVICVSAPARTPAAVRVRDFAHNQPVIKGDGWTVSKHQDESGLWVARLEGGGIVREFSGCGERDDWLRFFLWKGRGRDAQRIPDLLAVLRYAGGAHGREHLDIVDVENGLKILLSTDDHFNFQRLEDIDGDGWPEVVGFSRRFDPVLELSGTQSPHPTLVLARDSESQSYLCQNHRYPGELDSSVDRFRNAFALNQPVGAKVPYDPDNPKVHRTQFAPLVRWVVETCFTGREEEAWAILNDYATEEAAALAKARIADILLTDRYYQEMNRLMAP